MSMSLSPIGGNDSGVLSVTESATQANREKEKKALLEKTHQATRENLDNLKGVVAKSYQRFIDHANNPTISSVMDLQSQCKARELTFPAPLKTLLGNPTTDSDGITTYNPVLSELTEAQKASVKKGFIAVLQHMKQQHDNNMIYYKNKSDDSIGIDTFNGEEYAYSNATDSAESDVYSKALALAILQIDSSIVAAPAPAPAQESEAEAEAAEASEASEASEAPEALVDSDKEAVKIENILVSLFKDFKKNERNTTKSQMIAMYTQLIALPSQVAIQTDQRYIQMVRWISQFVSAEELNKIVKPETETKTKTKTNPELATKSPSRIEGILKKSLSNFTVKDFSDMFSIKRVYSLDSLGGNKNIAVSMVKGFQLIKEDKANNINKSINFSLNIGGKKTTEIQIDLTEGNVYVENGDIQLKISPDNTINDILIHLLKRKWPQSAAK